MFKHFKSKLFRSRASSPERKPAKLNDEKTESNASYSTTQILNQKERRRHSSSQSVENEKINGSNQDDEFQQTQQAQNSERNNRRRKTSPAGLESSLAMPEEIRNNPNMKTYWENRYKLFSKYDEGIELDAQMWYSVTPEKISRDIARRCQYDVVVDAFCGAGGNSIQFAFFSKKVITVEIDAERIKRAKHNADIYGVADRIEFIVGDFFKVAPFLKADAVFLSPPWGGPSYINFQEYSLNQIMEPYGGRYVYNTAKQISKNIVYFLPKNISIPELVSLEPDDDVEIEETYLDDTLFATTAYFGDLKLQ